VVQLLERLAEEANGFGTVFIKLEHG
jgi:hypothetical protein